MTSEYPTYSTTIAILKELGINSFQDYLEHVQKWERFHNRICKGGQSKIDVLRQAVVDDFQRFREKPILGQYISIDPNDINDMQLDNYMCIFPNHTLIETETLLTQKYSYSKSRYTYDLPPNDYFKNFFRYKDLIKRNIVQLYPVKDAHDYEIRKTFDDFNDYNPVVPLENVAHISQGKNFSRVAQRADYFYTEFPWLYNANTDVYLEICDKYPTEFQHLAMTIEKISSASNNGEEFNVNVLKDLREALNNIQIAFEQKQHSLKAKGITTILGFVLTCIPYAIPAFFDNFDPQLLSGIIGGTTIVKNSSMLNDFFDLKYAGIENPFWVVWKWQKTTK